MAEDDVAEVKNKLKVLKERFTAFERSHETYHSKLVNEAEVDESEEYFEGVEQNYIDAIVKFKDWIKTTEREEKPPMKSERDDLSKNELLSLMNLPKLELETFHGDPLHYHHFIAIFEEHVDRATSDGKLKLTRLLQCTSGPAKNAIRSCALLGGERGYEEARKILRQRFGDEHLICDRIVKNLRSGKPVKSPQELRQLADDLVSARTTLDSMKKLSEVDTQSTIVEILGRLQSYLQNRWKKQAMELKRKESRYPDFKTFVEFVAQVADEESDPVYGSVGKKFVNRSSTHDVKPKVSASSFSSNVSQPRRYPPCVACNGQHKLFFCDRFKSMKPPERLAFVQQHKLCENCLLQNHATKDCRRSSVCSVPNCGQRHTKFIHVDKTNGGESSSVLNANAKVNANANVNQIEVGSLCSSSDDVLVPVVKVVVNNCVATSALLDTASTNSFCTQKLVNSLGISGKDVNLSLSTLGASDQSRQTKLVNLNLKSSDGENMLSLSNVYVVDDIPARLPNAMLSHFAHLQDLPVHDVSPCVDVLIGQDNAEALIPLQTRRGGKGEPFAVKTLLGWSVNGPVSSVGSVSKRAISHFITVSNFDDHVKQLWDIESDPVSKDAAWSHEDKQVIKLWDARVQNVMGHYELPIPWKPNACLPHNLSQAIGRLQSTYRSLCNRSLVERYDGEIRKLLERGYAEPVPCDEECNFSKVWYLPHHAVLNPKKPEKVRVVFDCAAAHQGKSLNSQSFQGPDLNNRLVDVLMRFRQHQYAVIGDIEAMYHQVKIPLCDRDSLRFLWYDHGNSICHYRMTSHLFGGVWCAASATYALRRLLHDFPEVDSDVAEIVNRSFYVDDCLISLPNKDHAIRTVLGVRALLDKGGFNLTKFVSNDAEILASVPAEHRSKDMKDLSQDVQSRVLGVQWDIRDDHFYFDVAVRKDDVVTKRVMLSTVSSVFDPLGFVNPVVVAGRLLFQEAVRLKLSWDEPVPPLLFSKWCTWLNDLRLLTDFRIPRCIKPSGFDDAVIQLHHFSDASLQSYGFCSYIRAVNRSGEILVELLMSKCRVTPINAVSIPRLELQAALLAARADKMLREVLSIDILESFLWTDSSIVLSYIKSDSLRFHVYVGNRVGEIRSLTDPAQWGFVAGIENSADQITRGVSLQSINLESWLHGPNFLKSYMNEWPVSNVDESMITSSDPEVKQDANRGKVVSLVAAVSEHPIDKLVAHYSSWYRLKRAVAYWSRFIKHLRRGKDISVGTALSVDEIACAEVLIVKHVQSKHYSREVSNFSAGKMCKSGQLKGLSPVLDANGVLCVGGRLTHAEISLRRKHPYIIPYDHPISSLIARECHEIAHVGTEWTLSLLRGKFWITRARRVINRVRQNCVVCKRLFAKPAVQYMADLPPERVEIGNPPFSFVGMDCFGPFMVKQGRSDLKRYGCVFTCLNVRAVHIEVLHSMDADSFLNAFRRFSARRGLPLKVWSDNGSNFVGAQSELCKALKAMDKAKVVAYAVRNEIEWHFNPPGASHMGGVWERIIRTIRRVLSSLLINVKLSDEVLNTLLCEVENIVNCRPVTKLSNDACDDLALTPNHLLLLRGGSPPPPGVFYESDKYSRRWRHVQSLSNQYWSRWQREYLSCLQTRCKWQNVQSNVKVGDVVLIVDEHTPRGLWPLGRVTEVKVSRDGLVRSAQVKTKSTFLWRPIAKLVLLEGA